jgi:hypothetical protein
MNMSERLPGDSLNPPVDLVAARDSVAQPPPRTGLCVALALAAGLLAGIGSWAIGEATLTTFRPPLEHHEMMGQIIMKAAY